MLFGLVAIGAFPLFYNFPFPSLNSKKAFPVFGVSSVSQGKLNSPSIYTLKTQRSSLHDDSAAVFSKKKKRLWLINSRKQTLDCQFEFASQGLSSFLQTQKIGPPMSIGQSPLQ